MAAAERRLAAIMFTDMIGYTVLGQKNESLSLAIVEEQRNLIRPLLRKHSGREVKTMGDAFLVEFQSALDAVRCAYDIQRATRELNFSLLEDRRFSLRIGVHLGDVIESQGDVQGDAVNVASRIEPLAEAGGVCLTRQVYDHVRSKFELPLTSLGLKPLRNISTPVEVYRIVMPWEKEQTTSEGVLDPKRVAVMPFANMSPDPADEYFADGLTEELISTMSKMSELRVISRTSVMQYKGKSKSIGEIGKELRAGRILEGSVRKAGNRIRVTVQMIDAANDSHLWAETYDRELQDIFAIQSDIAHQVAGALRIKLLSSEKRDIEKRPTKSLEAYELYLKGRYHFRQRTGEDIKKALKYFEDSVNLDQQFALAFAGISDCYHYGSHENTYSPEEAFPKMRELATKALEIDPRLAEGHAALGAVYFHYDWNWQEAEKELTRAIELNPSYDSAYQIYGNLLAIAGRLEESYEQAKLRDDLAPEYGARGWGIGLSAAMIRLGKLGEGTAGIERVVRSDPDFALGHVSLAFAYYRASRTKEAISQMRQALDLSHGNPTFKAFLAWLLALAGQKDEASSILRELEEISKKAYVSNVQIACILHGLGLRDEAFENLERAYERREIDLPELRIWPFTIELRADPRWISLERRMGLREQ